MQKTLKMDQNTKTYVNKGRTSGDGMDNEELGAKTKKQDSEYNFKEIETFSNQQSQIRLPSRRKESSTVQVTVHHSKIPTTLVSTSSPVPGSESRTSAICLLENQKEKKNSPPLRLIRFEPSTRTKTSLDKRNQSPGVAKINKNNLDISVLATQMSNMRTQELDEMCNNKSICSADDSFEEKKLCDELAKIKEERDYFQSQLKFQTQVNSELKNLLVASIGEDMQTRVNVLTEDKLQLARALVNSANNLSTHTEQMEYLAGQCEVWRSKFLASSVMVEELARWKADLTQKNEMLVESTKQLLQTTNQIRQLQLDILKSLKFIAKIRYLNLPATDAVTLCAENLNIVQQIVLHSGLGIPDNQLDISSANSSSLCDAEIQAEKALKFISQPLMATDDAIRALFGQVQRPYTIPFPTESVSNDDIVLTKS